MKVIESKLQSEMEDLSLADAKRTASAAVEPPNMVGNDAHTCQGMKGRGGRWRFGPGGHKMGKMGGCHMKRQRMRMLKAMMENDNFANPEFDMPSFGGPMMWRGHHQHPPMFHPWMFGGMHGAAYARPHFGMAMSGGAPPCHFTAAPPMNPYAMMAMTSGHAPFMWQKPFCGMKCKGKKNGEKDSDGSKSSSDEESTMHVDGSATSEPKKSKQSTSDEETHKAKMHGREMRQLRWQMYANSFPGVMGMGPFGCVPPPPHHMRRFMRQQGRRCHSKAEKDEEAPGAEANSEMNIENDNNSGLFGEEVIPQGEHSDAKVTGGEKGKKGKAGCCHGGRKGQWRRAMAMHRAGPPPFTQPWWMPLSEMEDSEESDGEKDKNCSQGQRYRRGQWRQAMAMNAYYPGAMPVMPPPHVQRWMLNREHRCQKGKKNTRVNINEQNDQKNVDQKNVDDTNEVNVGDQEGVELNE